MTRDKRKKRKDHAIKKAVAKSYKSTKQAEKAQRKNARLNAKLDDEEEDIEALLKQFEEADLKKIQVTEEVSESPSARANASLVVSPLNQAVLYLFGGEHNGSKVQVYNDLFKYRIDKKEWRKISSANSPGPRSGHQTVALSSGKLFVFGGEYTSPSSSQFHHWKDCWMFDLKENKWDKLDIPTPPARSGHRMTVWKDFIVLFGGFYDNYKTTKYYDDLWIFDTNEYKWEKVELSAFLSKPSARSGFQLFTHEDTIYLYGGYCKKHVEGERDKGVVYSDMWALHMSTDITALRWERIKKTGTPPPPRAGCTFTVHKKRAILFGGVEDDEESDECVCQNDMYTFQLEMKKWFAFTVRADSGKKRNKEAGISGETEQEDDAEGSNEISSHQVPMPHPRYNAMMALYRNNLYLYGGLWEDKKEEFTLDDLWVLSVDKGGPWECLQKGSWEKGQEASKEEVASESSSSDDDCESESADDN